MYVKPRLKSKNHLGQFEFHHEQGLLYKSETKPFWPDLGDSLTRTCGIQPTGSEHPLGPAPPTVVATQGPTQKRQPTGTYSTQLSPNWNINSIYHGPINLFDNASLYQ
jgi:hypothetical protein